MRSSRVSTAGTTTKTKKLSRRDAKTTQTPPASAAAIALQPKVEVTRSTAASTRKAAGIPINIWRVIALLGVIAITVFIFSIRDRVEDLKEYGYIGIFFVAMLANATVLIPAPGIAIIYAMGAVFNPFLVGLAAGTGGAIGELSGYLAGFSGQAIIERSDVYDRIKPRVEKYGGWAVLVLSAIPNPFFDVAGIAAGIVKMPMLTFLFSVWIGQLIKMSLFAFAGRSSIELLSNYIK